MVNQDKDCIDHVVVGRARLHRSERRTGQYIRFLLTLESLVSKYVSKHPRLRFDPRP